MLWKTLALSLLLITPAAAQTLTQDSTGGDYMRASDKQRGMFLLAVAMIAAPDARKESVVVLSVKIGRCLSSAMTARNEAERPAVALLRIQKLSELAAMCVAMSDLD